MATHDGKAELKSLIVVVLVLCLGSARAQSEERWRSPCGVSLGSVLGLPGGGPPTATPEVLVAGMLPALETAKTAAESLKDKYISERFPRREVISHLNTLQCDGMPKVTITSQEIQSSFTNLNLTHLSNYEKLSQVLVFLEEVKFDETYIDRSVATYADDIQEIERSILNVLCTKQRLIRNSGNHINYVSPNVMTQDVRDTLNERVRHERDYLIVKDTYRLLQSMHLHVTAIDSYLSKNQ
ncbi:uncharacterized protein LOC132556560 [Ylistrum balloti]|uniref:uncharacterized protein LOC132556560 n=1 Tax=Ylistrum balloti TaxID=509963 RepID=UPI002905E5B2|nr:uncharacterized protein LOC132556560 [Ylistrum balloti]